MPLLSPRPLPCLFTLLLEAAAFALALAVVLALFLLLLSPSTFTSAVAEEVAEEAGTVAGTATLPVDEAGAEAGSILEAPAELLEGATEDEDDGGFACLLPAPGRSSFRFTRRDPALASLGLLLEAAFDDPEATDDAAVVEEEETTEGIMSTPSTGIFAGGSEVEVLVAAGEGAGEGAAGWEDSSAGRGLWIAT